VGGQIMTILAYVLLILGAFLTATSATVLLFSIKERTNCIFSIIFFIASSLMIPFSNNLIRRYDLDYINGTIIDCQKDIAEVSKKMSNYEEGTHEYEMIYVKYLKLNNKLSLYQSRFDNRIKQLKSNFKEEKK
jgi:hypothetical protein